MKISYERAEELRKEYAAGDLGYRRLARREGVAMKTIVDIVKGRTHKYANPWRRPPAPEPGLPDDDLTLKGPVTIRWKHEGPITITLPDASDRSRRWLVEFARFMAALDEANVIVDTIAGGLEA